MAFFHEFNLRDLRASGVASTAIWASGVGATAPCHVTDMDPCDEAVLITEVRKAGVKLDGLMYVGKNVTLTFPD